MVSDDVVQEHFICNLAACKGACCWEGDFGAPLEDEEKPVLDEIFDKIKPYMTAEGIAAVEQQGKYVWFEDMNGFGTPLIKGRACAYLNYDADGAGKCAIETAWKDGAVAFQKPISCHLYPIRVERFEHFDSFALNYDKWKICAAACTLGKKEKMPVYKFVKDAIVRRFGADFYEELDGAAEFLSASATPSP